MTAKSFTYEYAGFTYDIDRFVKSATPHRGQHPAATKEKHRRAALEMFKQDHPGKDCPSGRGWCNMAGCMGVAGCLDGMGMLG